MRPFVMLASGCLLAILSSCTWPFESSSLCVTETRWTAPKEGGTSPAVIVENCGGGDYFRWDVSSNCDWLTLSRTSGNTPGSFTITAAPNATGAGRHGAITVCARNAHGAAATIMVEQESRLFAEPGVYFIGGENSSICTADLRGDLTADLVVSGEMIYVLRYDWQYGILAEPDAYSLDARPILPAAADLNGDGYDDLLAGGVEYEWVKVNVLFNSGLGSFPSAAARYDTRCKCKPGSPVHVAAADFDGDGAADIAVSQFGCGYVAVLKNLGDGTFAAAEGFASGPGCMELVARDLDGDGDMDIAVACSNMDAVSVLRNVGDGRFAWPVAYPAGEHPESISFGDVDADGDDDLFVTNSEADCISVLANRGDGTFEAPRFCEVGKRPVSVVCADLNRDGYADAAVANHDSGSMTVLVNRRDGTLEVEGTYATGDFPTTVIAVDLDRDRDFDLAVAGAGSIRIFKNLLW
jgi:hypothetical protein